MNITRQVLLIHRTYIFLAISLLHVGHSAAGNIAIDTVPVGNLGNLADTNGYGAVSYAYNIGTYEVTNAQYAAFLNAKAANDPLGLYNTNMGSGLGGITRSGASGSYSYSTISRRENTPVNYVSWYDAIRFANWLHNGQGSGDTETGAYTLGALAANGIPLNPIAIARNAAATWFLTSEDEWYKAAYSLNDGTNPPSNYSDYPNGSDTPPDPGTPGEINGANYDDVIGDVLNVGFYPGTPGPWGTFDQGGNVWEWNESLKPGFLRGMRGGSYIDDVVNLSSSIEFHNGAALESDDVGFRVATVPEPGSSMLAGLGALGALLFLRRRK